MLHTALRFDLYMLEERASVFEQGTVAYEVQHQRNFGIACKHLVFLMNGGNVHICPDIILLNSLATFLWPRKKLNGLSGTSISLFAHSFAPSLTAGKPKFFLQTSRW